MIFFWKNSNLTNIFEFKFEFWKEQKQNRFRGGQHIRIFVLGLLALKRHFWNKYKTHKQQSEQQKGNL